MGACSSEAILPPIWVSTSRRLIRSLTCFLPGLILLACAGGSGGHETTPDPSAPASLGEAVRSTAATAARSAVPDEPSPHHAFPEDALDLLARSARDSCVVCARRNREEAFELLDDFYPPGTLVVGTAESTFLPVSIGENELSLSSYERDIPRLTFRFHTSENRLVGIVDEDLTVAEVLEYWSTASGGAELVGLVEIIPYAYGDGPTYLYSPGQIHLQVQCRVIELETK